MLAQCPLSSALCDSKILAKLFPGDLYLCVIASQFLSHKFFTGEIAEAEPQAKGFDGVSFIVTENLVGKRIRT